MQNAKCYTGYLVFKERLYSVQEAKELNKLSLNTP